MARHKNSNWNLQEKLETYPEAQLAVLMDIRDELQRLNTLLHCHNFLRVPAHLAAISRNTKKKKPKARRQAT